MPTSDWNAAQYLAFADERTRPATDLLERVQTPGPARCLDLGCGPGNSTELLCRRYPDADISGIDLSPDMLAEARTRLPGVPFARADLATWRAEGAYDLLFSNAVLQWLPNHETLLARLAGCLTAGGSLAIQMPDNLDEPSHAAMRDTAGTGPWAARAAAMSGARTAIAGLDAYYRWLRGADCAVDMWRTTYLHPLKGTGAIVEWFRSTGLKPYLDLLSVTESQEFLARYEEKLARAYPAQPDGTVLLRFPRLFIVARRVG